MAFSKTLGLYQLIVHHESHVIAIEFEIFIFEFCHTCLECQIQTMIPLEQASDIETYSCVDHLDTSTHVSIAIFLKIIEEFVVELVKRNTVQSHTFVCTYCYSNPFIAVCSMHISAVCSKSIGIAECTAKLITFFIFSISILNFFSDSILNFLWQRACRPVIRDISESNFNSRNISNY